MAYFMINYDLEKSKDYQKLITELERLGAAKAALSSWFVELDNTTSEVRDHLSGFVDDDDILIVTAFITKPRYTRMKTPGHNWLNDRFN
ncbi:MULTISPECIES: hypothetical protein [unclassified Hyphomonas]|jgi:radical SAM superfamily enzyme YgiQ (UPF0313 family)|uniref:hypothetical protein n=1 Tax=unclassified Hyphomonas TaxID=2630699 RepID=UPI000C8A5A62|nr:MULTISPECIES: hypothetical protein [unclassified Hyphomonas]MAL45370.1 CRISPR-associated protein Cas2 [Hyphomonas sp.]HAO35243.1 CRISPR-associated protein Cas2 [Hyphomonas sp.]HAQ76850.1 CRISPR-associated protein Cas2 [Hyphomonas sp.]HAW55978.1 CRISPR-associated protein Cas2 [Hyphomonas sp.]HBN94275.1 CRISPR-associated protein Cas2 [Hyphomonas sp.]|tara:strand:+ start:5145 stop:5411 length:267 start_codon:yes stop_codon:yes gene_type:complete